MHRYLWPGQIARELRQALRRLASTPLFTLFSIVTLALAIGITTAVYSTVVRLFDRDAAVREPERLIGIHTTTFSTTGSRLPSFAQPTRWSIAATGQTPAALSLPDYRDVASQQQTFSHLAAWGTIYTSINSPGTATMALGEIVSGSYFHTLGAGVQHGRVLLPDDDRLDAPPAIVLSNVTWRTRFHAEPTIVGRTLLIAGQPFTVVGVAGPSVHGLSGEGRMADFWVPLAFAPNLSGGFGRVDFDPESRTRSFLRIVGRVQPPFSIEQASEDLRLIGRRLDEAYPPPTAHSTTAALRSRSWSAGPAFPPRPRLLSVPAAVIALVLPALVLLVACTNLANLALSRGVVRRNSIAVKHALGASRWRLIREEMSEAAIVAMAGGVIGLGIARTLLTTGFGLLRDHTAVPEPFLPLDLTVSPAVFMPVFGATLLSLAIGGLLPALQLSRVNVRQAMASDTDTLRPRGHGRGNLIALQVSASVGLFLIAVAGAQALPSARLHSGPRLDGVAVAAIPFGQQQYDEVHARDTLDRVLADVRRTLGVRTVAIGTGVSESTLIPSSFTRSWVTTVDRPFTEANTGTSSSLVISTPEIFDVLALRVVEGRLFSDADSAGRADVSIIDEALARDLFGTAPVVGRTLLVRMSGLDTRDVTTTIVGVVQARDTSASRNQRKYLYLPFAQHYDPNVTVLARASDDVPPVAPLRAALRGADPGLATAFIGDGALLTDTPIRILGAVVLVAHGLAAFALVLSIAGLYGVLSHVVARRMRELAVRVALGATAGRIIHIVLRDGLRPVAEGLLIGLGAALVIRQLLRATVAEELSAIDPIAFGIAALLLVTAGLIACYIPARRAARVDPNVMLKEP